MENKIQDAKRILSYWKTTSFLTQPDFNSNSKKFDFNQALKKNKTRIEKSIDISFNCSETKVNNHDIVLFDDVFIKIHDYLEQYKNYLITINENLDDEKKIKVEPLTGKITFEFGWVRRQCCIDAINELLKSDSNEEENNNKIAYFGFQLDNDGKYTDTSLSISPILWSIDALKNQKAINQENCGETKNDLQKLYFDNEMLLKGNDDCQIAEMRTMGFSAEDAISPKYIKYINAHICNKYVNPVLKKESDFDALYKVSFAMYANREELEKANEQDQHYSLSMDFYSEDIDMVKNSLNEQDEVLFNYICSNKDDNTERIDVLNDSNKMKSKIKELTDLRNAPLGKWPSQYNLAFMQQLAVNIETSQTLCNQPVFSVNGPPGTGKTTLLKEIIVDNIISRAKILSEYKNPDDLFEQRNFLHGDATTGNAYSQYQPYWYSLNNKEVSKYNVLIASSNNTAVENITKELPKLKDVISVSDNENTWISKEKYQEISDLFNPSVNCEGDEGKRDIYFNEIAKKYIEDEIKEDCWGVIAAPLGKKKNIRNYYWGFLNQIFGMMRGKKDSVSENYQRSKDNFLEQYEKVLALQEKINKPKLLEIELTTKDIDEKIFEKQQKLKNLDEENKNLIAELNSYDIQNLEKQNEDLKINKAKLQEKIKEINQDINRLNLKNNNLNESLFEIQSSITWIAKLFNTKKYQVAKEQAYNIQNEVNHLQNSISSKEKQLAEENKRLKDCYNKIMSLEDETKKFNEKNDAYNLNCQKLKETKEELEGFLQDKKTREQRIIELEQEQSKIKKCLEKQAEGITSKEKDIKEQAHINNLWLTADYDVERMKLFYYALEFNKEFVLSSYCLNKNLRILGTFWRFSSENIKYNPEDMNVFAKSLFQSLFLVTPVISTTFASVNRMFGYVKEQNVFGTLIVDEAGQAEPKMAIGALYRCNKAMIVGDPKQIEPVIDEDTKKLCKGLLNANDDNVALSSSESVQSYADRMNQYGTVLKSSEKDDEWVGLPLAVHRRCNSPMFEISNLISYGGIMVKKTVQKPFNKGIYKYSKWIEVNGNEKGKKNHYVEEQGQKVIEMLKIAKANGNLDKVFVITPFKTISSEMIEKVKKEADLKEYKDDFWRNHIGTVHTFQGKESDEVIFVLGCDEKAVGAVKWVNSNIVNVAASRAKQRFYIVGAINVWKTNKFILQAKNCLDLETFKKIVNVLDDKKLLDVEKKRRLKVLLNELPSKKYELTHRLSTENELDEEQDDSYEIGIQSVIPPNTISPDVLNDFGFSSIDDLNEFSGKTKLFLKNGLLVYSLILSALKQSGADYEELDTSSCAIEFVKALELQTKDTFIDSIKELFPTWKIKKKKPPLFAKDAQEKEFTLGAIWTILENNKNKQFKGNNFFEKPIVYKAQFVECLKKCTNIRNNTAHSELFSIEDLENLRKFGFRKKADGECEELTDGLLCEMLHLQDNHQKNH